MNIRSFTLAGATALALAAVGVAGDAAKLAPHPHFNDGGTLGWSSALADARTAAKKADRLIFIEYGREA